MGMRTLIAVCLVGVLGAGCARYEYDIVQPPELVQHIGTEETTVDQPPLRFRMVSYDNRLVLRIHNTSDQPILLVGERSWVVTPDGQSLALQQQTITPGAFVKLILPPMRTQYHRRGPAIGIGFGVSSGGSVGTGVGMSAPIGRERYVREEEPLWDWDGGQEVRMHLVFEHDGSTVAQSFTFVRTKM